MPYETNPFPTRGKAKAKSGIVRDMMGDVEDARKPINNDRTIDYSISRKTKTSLNSADKGGDILGADYKTGGSIERD